MFLSQRDDIHSPSDFLDRNQLALAGAGTRSAHPVPGFPRAQVAVPERPGAALARPHRVDRAAGAAVVKHAIAVRLLAQRAAAVVFLGMDGDEFFPWLLAELGDGVDFLVVDPNIAGRAGAAVAAAGAREAKPILVPRSEERRVGKECRSQRWPKLRRQRQGRQ